MLLTLAQPDKVQTLIVDTIKLLWKKIAANKLQVSVVLLTLAQTDKVQTLVAGNTN